MKNLLLGDGSEAITLIFTPFLRVLMGRYRRYCFGGLQMDGWWDTVG